MKTSRTENLKVKKQGLETTNRSKLIKLDLEQIIIRRAEKSLRQAQEHWKKMNRDYPATLDDHIFLSHLIADYKCIVCAFYIEGALIIGIDPETPEPVKVGEFLNYFPWDFRFQIIATGAKEPTIRDGEKLLESLERTNLALEQRRRPNQDGQKE